jgi:hypothetical protein
MGFERHWQFSARGIVTLSRLELLADGLRDLSGFSVDRHSTGRTVVPTRFDRDLLRGNLDVIALADSFTRVWLAVEQNALFGHVESVRFGRDISNDAIRTVREVTVQKNMLRFGGPRSDKRGEQSR